MFIIMLIVYFVGLVVELCYDYVYNKKLLNEILSGNHLMDEQMKLIKFRRYRYKFGLILLRAILWPMAELYAVILFYILDKRNKNILDYYE